MKKLLCLAIALMLALTAIGALAETTDLPRNETLYFAGQQWGSVNSWNIIGTNQNNSMAIAGNAGGYRTLMFETLYMYNFLNGELIGLLANDDYAWNEDMTQLTLTIKDAAKWSDGTPVTAADVQRTFDIGVEIGNGTGTGLKGYIESIEADGNKVIINAKLNDEGKPVNPLKVMDFLTGTPIAQAAWIDTVVERNNGDAVSILNDAGEDVVWSGPYTKYFADDQKVVLIRDDNYWGQDESMWGKLPVPKYIAHAIYADNPAGENALKAGEVDVCQQFIGNVQNLWLEDGLPISTFYEEAPYGVCLTMPTAWYNFNIPVLAENPALRKAIAMAVDYDTIIANAMTNQSPSFSDVPRSLMNPTEGEQALYDHEAVADLQWAGMDIDGANALLDEAGLVARVQRREDLPERRVPQRLDRLAGFHGSGRGCRQEHRHRDHHSVSGMGYLSDRVHQSQPDRLRHLHVVSRRRRSVQPLAAREPVHGRRVRGRREQLERQLGPVCESGSRRAAEEDPADHRC